MGGSRFKSNGDKKGKKKKIIYLSKKKKTLHNLGRKGLLWSHTQRDMHIYISIKRIAY